MAPPRLVDSSMGASQHAIPADRAGGTGRAAIATAFAEWRTKVEMLTLARACG
jgi:hypothetical protein